MKTNTEKDVKAPEKHLEKAVEVAIKRMEGVCSGTRVVLCGFIVGVRLIGKNKAFLVVREGSSTVQIVAEAKALGEEEMQRVRALFPESYICIEGVAAAAPSSIESCTVKSKEIKAQKITVISFSEELPFQIKDASWSAEERKANPALPTVALGKRLDCRWLDLRTAETRAIFRIHSRVLRAFRAYFEVEQYIEIKTPKILGGCSDGGADVFSIDYFGSSAVLAQSPQLYKQMAVIGGLQRVYEIGPCFRAENSNTGRHLTEFIGVDLERELGLSCYTELVKEIYRMIRRVVEEVQRECIEEIEAVRKMQKTPVPLLEIPEQPVVLAFKECVDILIAVGRACEYSKDIGTEDERVLGAEIKKKYSTDLFAVIEYPESARPFYTSMHPEKKGVTRSFDFILRGEEISSGAERIHQKKLLIERVQEKGVAVRSIQGYIDAFSCGVPRHGGCGIGLERVVKLIAGLTDIHKCSMFPRDPSRLHP